MIHRLGAHLSISGGYCNPLEKIVKIGGNALQIFSSSPRWWHFAVPSDGDIAAFVDKKRQLGIDPVYFHASYLINLGSAERTGEMSRRSLIHELGLAKKMGVRGSIVHLGSFKNHTDAAPSNIADQLQYKVLINNISDVLSAAPADVLFMIENAGNRKIGRSIEEIGQIIKDVNDKRLRVCLDTCHLHAAGYDLTTKDKVNAFLDVFDKLVGLNRLELWHMNDSRDPLGSLRDRHDNIGEGTVGIEVFENILNHPDLRNLSFIIETPGFDDTGPDKKNLDLLKSLI